MTDRLPKPLRRSAHFAYWNPILRDHYCHTCGDVWPCLPKRQQQPTAAGPDECTCPDLPAGHNDDECALASWARVRP